MESKRRREKRNILDEAARLVQELRNDPEMVHRVHVGQCTTFVRFAIESARDSAKCGKRDEARIWCKFLLNSHVLDVLEHCGAGPDVSQMRSELSLLRNECHPLDVADFASDLSFIRAALEEVLRRTGGVAVSPALSVVPQKVNEL